MLPRDRQNFEVRLLAATARVRLSSFLFPFRAKNVGGIGMPYYSERLLEHVRTPRNGGAMESPDAVGRSSLEGRAPYTAIFLKGGSARIEQAMFQTFGCGVSIAACSALTELVRGKSAVECASLEAKEIEAALDGVPEEKAFCVVLALNALRDALSQLH